MNDSMLLSCLSAMASATHLFLVLAFLQTYISIHAYGYSYVLMALGDACQTGTVIIQSLDACEAARVVLVADGRITNDWGRTESSGWPAMRTGCNFQPGYDPPRIYFGASTAGNDPSGYQQICKQLIGDTYGADNLQVDDDFSDGTDHGWNCDAVESCGSAGKVCGGPTAKGAGSIIQKVFPVTPGDYLISFECFLFDTWSAGEKIWLYVEGVMVWEAEKAVCHATTAYCGRTDADCLHYVEEEVHVSGWSMNVSVFTNLDEVASNEAYAIRNFKIYKNCTAASNMCDQSSTTTTSTTTATTSTTTTTTVAITTSVTTTTSSVATMTLTATATTLFVATLDGSVRLEVVNAAEFVKEPNVTAMFRVAIAGWFEVNVSWVHDVDVSLRDGRRLARTNDNRLLSLSEKPTEEVDVTWTLEIPPGQNTVIVNVLVENYNQKTVSEITGTINTLIASGMLGDPYDLNVTWNYAWVPESETVKTEQGTSSADSGTLIIIVIICIVLSVVLILVVALIMLARRRHTALKTKKKKGTFAEIAGPLREARLEDLLLLPPEISAEKGREAETLLQAISACQGGEPSVFITYALGSRPDDAEGYGPGTFYVAAVAKFLFENGVPCFCDVMLGEFADRTARRHVFSAQLSGRFSSCELVIVILTDAVFTCLDSLRDIHTAQENKFQIFPLRFEHPIPNERHPWPQIKRHQMEEMMMATAVERGFCKLNSIPSPPYTIVNQPDVLKDMLQDLKDLLGSDSKQAPEKQSTLKFGRKSMSRSAKDAHTSPNAFRNTTSDNFSVPSVSENTPFKASIDISPLDLNAGQSPSELAVKKQVTSKDRKDKGRTGCTKSQSSSTASTTTENVVKSTTSCSSQKSRRRPRSLDRPPGDLVKPPDSPRRRGRGSFSRRGRDMHAETSIGRVKSTSSTDRRQKPDKSGSRIDNASAEEDRRRKQVAATKIQKVERGHLVRAAKDKRKSPSSRNRGSSPRELLQM